MKTLVSACLLGENCKYNGGNNLCPKVLEYVKNQEIIPICPEKAAGMGCPRTPVEIVNGVLTDKNGKSWDDAMRKTVAQLLDSLKNEEIRCAILKSRSPTCGVKQVYDGTFSGKLVDGSGLFAQALMDAGYTVIEDEDL